MAIGTWGDTVSGRSSAETGYATLLTPAEAASRILRHITPMPVQSANLRRTLRAVIADDVYSPIDIPHWDNSAMDGYAVRADDVRNRTPVELDIIEDIPAGRFPERTVQPGTCSRIYTGAPIPAGADTVIRQEDTALLDPSRVVINDARDAGRNIRPRGEDIRRGDMVIRRGTELRPAHLGILASIAQREVRVVRTPNVAFLGSGDEIADLDQRDDILAGRKIASSNSYTLHSMTLEAGAKPLDLGIARDDPRDLRDRIASANDGDLLVTSAGVSVGEHDYLRTVIEEMGGEMQFWRIRMRPGAPVGFGMLGRLPWIGLPGNPVSTMVTFELFVRPVIRKMRGLNALFRRTVPVTVAEPIRTHARLQHFLRVIVTDRDGVPTARPTGPQGSGILSSMVLANALLIVPEDRQEIAAGEVLPAIRLDGEDYVEKPNY